MTTTSKAITKRPLYNVIDGIWHPASFSPKCFREALNYVHQSDDVFIITYPKCGTTWMQNVALYIFRKGKELEETSLFLTHCPFIDMIGQEGIDKMPRPGALKTHIPYNRLQHSSEAKYIFVARNPKDCVVSFFHHTNNQPSFSYWNADFDEFFELFMAGEVEYNDYFDHLMSWYPHRNNPNVFYTTYEQMKRDIRGVILNLAKFLGDEYIEVVEKDNSVMNNIVLYSSFNYMKTRFSDLFNGKPKESEVIPEHLNYEGLAHLREYKANVKAPENLQSTSFIRKGVVGDWKNVLNEEQVERLDKKFLERTKGTDIPNWFMK